MATLDLEDLARTGGTWRGALPVSRFARVAREIDNDQAAVELELAFGFDEEGRCRVTGSARVAGWVSCHRCLERVAHDIEATLDLRVVRTEAAARALTPEYDTVVVRSGRVTVEALVEDDLMMSVPTRVCTDAQTCPNAPKTEYGASDVAEDDGSTRPFAGLAALIEAQNG